MYMVIYMLTLGVYICYHIYIAYMDPIWDIYIQKKRTETLYQVTSYCKPKFHPLAVDSDIAQLAPPE